MKCKEIHCGLENKDVRDFLAKSADFCNDSYIALLEQQLEEIKNKINDAKEKMSAMLLIKKMGWSMFDVSDDVDDYKCGEYFNFVGTEDEFRSIFCK